MYTTDPFQLSLAGYRLAGMMFENQMRVMLAVTDATFAGKNPFVTPPVSRRETTAPTKSDAQKAAKPQIARVVKPRPTPETVKQKRARKPSAPPPMPPRPEALHPAE